MYHFYLNFILFLHTGHANFDLIDIQYLQNVVFSFEKGLNGFKDPLDQSECRIPVNPLFHERVEA